MREALSFLTVMPGRATLNARALRWFPVVGAAVGLALGGIWWLASRVWQAPVAAAVVVAADLAITGLLHFDGLVDAADGLLPHLAPSRRLEVMSEPTVGAFGIGVAGAFILLRWSALWSLHPAPLLLGALWCVSRSAMATCIDRVTYARGDDGLAAKFGGSPLSVPTIVLALAASFAAATWWKVPAGPAALGAGLVCFALVIAFSVRRIGGYTGDVLGAAGVVAETAGLLVAAVRW
jgi:adenosylcobinamide-GDP ribazoletransferase